MDGNYHKLKTRRSWHCPLVRRESFKKPWDGVVKKYQTLFLSQYQDIQMLLREPFRCFWKLLAPLTCRWTTETGITKNVENIHLQKKFLRWLFGVFKSFCWQKNSAKLDYYGFSLKISIFLVWQNWNCSQRRPSMLLNVSGFEKCDSEAVLRLFVRNFVFCSTEKFRRTDLLVIVSNCLCLA